MKTPTLFVALMAANALAACGLDDLGVRQVSFQLEPSAIVTPPEGVDSETLAALEVAMGSVHADMLEDDMHVATMGLPDLPTGFAYVAMGSFADDPRAAIPGGDSGGETGHTHGAITASGRVLGSEEHALETVVLGPLESEAGGMWEIELSSADLADVEMGALRAAMVMLVSETGSAVAVLMGEVGQEETTGASAGEEGGHTHGP